ncbi:hypothetical protein SPONL_190 [uncultured Candidatus Thioglobus sp.]|nr:hypothetical protein SPONL_190 [uncultured Candidatus Thioglobus sp.]
MMLPLAPTSNWLICTVKWAKDVLYLVVDSQPRCQFSTN